jgi:hypothetical protein
LGTPCNFPGVYFGHFSVVRTSFFAIWLWAEISSFCILNLKRLTSSVNLWHLGVDLSILRCKKMLQIFFHVLGAHYCSYTFYRRSLLELERPEEGRVHLAYSKSGKGAAFCCTPLKRRS